MLQTIVEAFYWMLGANQEYSQLSTIQMILRTIIVFGIALLMIRLGKRRFLGGYTAFDILIGFVVGSIMSRAITGRESLVNTIIVILTLMALHYVISYVTYHFDKASKMVKNDERELIKDGEINQEAMRKSKLGENDLLQALRRQGKVRSPEEVECAFLERDGSITVIPKKAEPKVLEVAVEKGVQTVKIVVS